MIVEVARRHHRWQRRQVGDYRQAVDLRATVRTLIDADRRPDDFGPYAAEVRARHKPKRNLMKLFDQRCW